MKILVSNIKASLDEDDNNLKKMTADKMGIGLGEIKNFRIVKESLDARRKSNIHKVFSILVEVDESSKIRDTQDIKVYIENELDTNHRGDQKLHHRPIIIGSGPAGLFAGFILAQNGFRPIIFERGECVEKRAQKVDAYWRSGKLDIETNVQFGEGGAGTFSDGKLTTRINDQRCDHVLKIFYDLGAPEEIMYQAKPHIGSDRLRIVIKNMRQKIEDLGGEFHFNSKMTAILSGNGQIRGVNINGNEEIPGEVIVLAIGHSARDTFATLYDQGIKMVGKSFSIGTRIEHRQEMINATQYGRFAHHTKLGAADYQLSYKTLGRTAYSFCMCPGGTVVASASENETIVTNGMSNYLRNEENANSAFVVSVNPEDFESNHPLSGIDFQRKWERLAFDIGGRCNAAPIQTVKDFLNNQKTHRIGTIKPSYTGEVALSDLNECLPRFVTDTMKESLGHFERKLKGFSMADAILTGVETRTSSPVRILRGTSYESEGLKGLYPTGEGAGYAGGIMSAAVDGIKVAEQILINYAPP